MAIGRPRLREVISHAVVFLLGVGLGAQFVCLGLKEAPRLIASPEAVPKLSASPALIPSGAPTRSEAVPKLSASPALIPSASGAPTRLSKDACYKQRDPFRSHCPSWSWLTTYHKPDEQRHSLIFVDIGCNKGYSSARMFERWLPGGVLSQKTLGKSHKKHDTPKHCGICKDCQDKPADVPQNAAKVSPHVYCIDGSPRTLARTQNAVEDLVGKPAKGWHFHNLAFSNFTGKVRFGDCDSMESCGMRKGEDAESNVSDLHTAMIEVNAITLTAFADSQNLDFLDIVKMDVEGEEPMVILGMLDLLRNHRIGILALEMNGNEKGWWKQYPLRWIVETFDKFNYDCYLDGDLRSRGSAFHDRLLKLTGCMDFSKFYPEHKAGKKTFIPNWGNAVCGLRGAHGGRALQELSDV